MNNLSVIDKAPQVASALVSVSLFVAVLYDYAFFKCFGISISQMPFSLEDHIKSSIDSFAFVSIFSISFFVARVIPIKGDVNIRSQSPWEKLKNLNYFVYINILSSITFFYHGFHARNDFTAIALFSLSCLTFYFGFAMLFYRHLSKTFGPKFRIILMIAPIIASVPLVGFLNGVVIKEGSGVRVVFGESSQGDEYLLVKATSEYLVVWDVVRSEIKFKERERVGEFRLIAN